MSQKIYNIIKNVIPSPLGKDVNPPLTQLEQFLLDVKKNKGLDILYSGTQSVENNHLAKTIPVCNQLFIGGMGSGVTASAATNLLFRFLTNSAHDLYFYVYTYNPDSYFSFFDSAFGEQNFRTLELEYFVSTIDSFYSEFEKRKNHVTETTTTTFPLCNVFILIDLIDSFLSPRSQFKIPDNFYKKIVELMIEGHHYGIYFICTSSSTIHLPDSVIESFGDIQTGKVYNSSLIANYMKTNPIAEKALNMKNPERGSFYNKDGEYLSYPFFWTKDDKERLTNYLIENYQKLEYGFLSIELAKTFNLTNGTLTNPGKISDMLKINRRRNNGQK